MQTSPPYRAEERAPPGSEGDSSTEDAPPVPVPIGGRWMAAAAAVIAAVGLGLFYWNLQLQSDLDRAENRLEAMATRLARADSARLALRALQRDLATVASPSATSLLSRVGASDNLGVVHISLRAHPSVALDHVEKIRVGTGVDLAAEGRVGTNGGDEIAASAAVDLHGMFRIALRVSREVSRALSPTSTEARAIAYSTSAFVQQVSGAGADSTRP